MMTQLVKCLSIQQPHAWLITHAKEYLDGKDIKNWDWNTSFKGRILVHAGKKPDERFYSSYAGTFIKPTIGRFASLFPSDFSERINSEECIGGIVGCVTLVDCVRSNTSPWFVGRYGFVLADPMPLLFMPQRGQPGLFDVDLDQVIEWFRTHGNEFPPRTTGKRQAGTTETVSQIKSTWTQERWEVA